VDRPPIFFEYVDARLRSEAALTVIWSDDKLTCTIKKSTRTGFDIVIAHDPDSATLHLGTDCGYHDHFHLDSFDSQEDGIATLLGIVRDLLAPTMRILEVRAGSKSRKWELQSLVNNRWQTEGTMGLLIWNPFAKRTEVVYTNNTLSPREHGDA